jgi:hypothetical protein
VKIYIAGASAEIDLIESFISRVRTAGHEITFDWTVKVREVGSASPDDLSIRRVAAETDRKGVADSELTWIVQPEASSTSTGAWVELGIALGLKLARPRTDVLVPPMLVVSGPSTKCIFSDLADFKFQAHDEALAFIVDKMPKAKGAWRDEEWDRVSRGKL